LPFFQVQLSHYKKHQGLISKVCEERFSAAKNPTPGVSSWHAKEGDAWCPGKRQDVNHLILSIPAVFAIEVGDESAGVNRHSGEERQHWDFPATITPDSQINAKKFGVIYDLNGCPSQRRERPFYCKIYISRQKADLHVRQHEASWPSI
jgi:hypothetical protein